MTSTLHTEFVTAIENAPAPAFAKDDIVEVSHGGKIRYGVVREVVQDEERGVYVDLFTDLGDGRFSFWGEWFAPCQLKRRSDVVTPAPRLNARDRHMATRDSEELSRDRLQAERTIFYVNGY